MDLIHFNNSEDLFKENRFVFEVGTGGEGSADDGTEGEGGAPAEGAEGEGGAPAEGAEGAGEQVDYAQLLTDAKASADALDGTLTQALEDDSLTKKTQTELGALQQELAPILSQIQELDATKEADQAKIKQFSDQLTTIAGNPSVSSQTLTASATLKAKIDDKREALEAKKAEITTEAVIDKVMEGLAIQNTEIAEAIKKKITDTKSGEIEAAITEKVSTLDAILTEADTTLDPTTVDLAEWETTYVETTVDYNIDDYATLINTAPFEGANDAVADLDNLPGEGEHAKAAKEKAIAEIIKAIESSTGDIDFQDIIHNERQDIINAHIADVIGETPEKIAGALNKYALGSYEALSTENKEILQKIFTTEFDGVNLVGYQGETDGTDWQKRTSPGFHKGQAATLRKVLDYGDNLSGNKTLDSNLIEEYITLADAGKGWDFFKKADGTIDQTKYDAFFKGGGYFDTALSFQRAEDMKLTKGKILAEGIADPDEKAALIEAYKNLDPEMDKLYLRQNGDHDNADQRVSKLLFDVAEVEDHTPDFGTGEIEVIKKSDYFTKQAPDGTGDDAVLRAAQEEAKDSKWEGKAPAELADDPAFRKAVVDRLKVNADDDPDEDTEDLQPDPAAVEEHNNGFIGSIHIDGAVWEVQEPTDSIRSQGSLARRAVNDQASIYKYEYKAWHAPTKEWIDINPIHVPGAPLNTPDEEEAPAELSPDNIPDLMYAQLEEIINNDDRFSAAVPQEQMEAALIRAMSEVAADGTQLDASDPTIVQEILHTATNILAVDISEGEDVDDSENAGAQWDVLDVAPNQGDAIKVELPGLMENIQVDVPRAAITKLKIIASDSSPIQYLYSDEYIAQKIAEAHNTYQQMTPYMGVSFTDRNILELAVSLLDPDKSQEGTVDVVDEGGVEPGEGVEAPAGVETEMPDVIRYNIQEGVLFHDTQGVYGDDVYVKFKEDHADKETAITDRFKMNDLALKVWPDGTITAEGTSSEYVNPADPTAPMFVELVLRTPDADPTHANSWIYSDDTTQRIVDAEGKID